MVSDHGVKRQPAVLEGARGFGGRWGPRENGFDSYFPLIFAGGQTATSNPEPYADFFDFIALGDGEELLPEIGLIVQEGKRGGLTTEELLLDLAQVPGVYVPKFYSMAEDGSVFPIQCQKLFRYCFNIWSIQKD